MVLGNLTNEIEILPYIIYIFYVNRYTCGSDFSVGLLCEFAPASFLAIPAKAVFRPACRTAGKVGYPVKLHEMQPFHVTVFFLTSHNIMR
jgi:hypothetical protein